MAAPANDDFADRELIGGESGLIIRTNVDATSEGSEPVASDAANHVGKTIWFEWVAPHSGTFRFTVVSSFGKSFFTYTGSTLGTLSNPNLSGTRDSSGDDIVLDVVAVSATSYKLQLGSCAFDPLPEGDLTLSWAFGDEPVGVAGVCVAFDNVALSTELFWTRLG